MLTVEMAAWGQTEEDLREQALTASHPRTRERFMALFEIVNGSNATQVGLTRGRNPQTVMDWVHRYNQQGPSALTYQRTGGAPPLCRKR